MSHLPAHVCNSESVIKFNNNNNNVDNGRLHAFIMCSATGECSSVY